MRYFAMKHEDALEILAEYVATSSSEVIAENVAMNSKDSIGDYRGMFCNEVPI